MNQQIIFTLIILLNISSICCNDSIQLLFENDTMINSSITRTKRGLISCTAIYSRWVLEECASDILQKFNNEQELLVMDVNNTFNQILSELTVEQKLHTITHHLLRFMLLKSNLQADDLMNTYEMTLQQYDDVLALTKNYTSVFTQLYDDMAASVDSLHLNMSTSYYSSLYLSAFALSIINLILVFILYIKLCKIGSYHPVPITIQEEKPPRRVAFDE